MNVCAELSYLAEKGAIVSAFELYRMRERSQLVVAALRSGMSVEEVRAKFQPELHAKILARTATPPWSPRIERRGAAVVWGYVYVFAAGPLVKVGMSDVGVASRWQNIRCSNPLLEPPLYVSGALGDHARQAERRAHEILAPYHETGEWFRCDRELAVKTVKTIEKEYAS